MRKHLIAMFGSVLFAAAVAGAATPSDLSSPKEALKSYIQLQCKGATLEQWRNVVSKEYFTIISALDLATQGQTDLSEKMPPEDKYATLTIVKKQATDDRAIFQVRVQYKDSWLQKEMNGRIPSDQKTGGEAISDASPGEEAQYPCHIKGEGYVSFLFLKQDGTWRFHKSYASNQPSDFTPLLNAKDLSGGFTVKARTEPSPSLPDAVPDQPLAGRHSGKEWRGLFAYHDASRFRNDEDHYGVNVFEKEEPDEFKRLGLSLILKLPKKPGEYKLSPTFNVTFYEPPGKNTTAMEGILKVSRDGSTYKAYLIAHFDKDNDVRGYFTFTPPKGK